MGSLPNGVVQEILSRMPPKNAMQMSCICKNWQNLINSPNFPSLHLQNFTKKEGNLRLCKLTHEITHFESEDCIHLCEEGRPHQDSPAVLNCEHNCSALFSIVGIINGVVCFAYRLRIGIEGAYLWNPILKRKFTIRPRQEYIPFLSINPRAHESLGFGYDESTNDLKLFSILSVREQYLPTIVGPERFDIYSLNSRERTDVPRPDGFNFVIANPTRAVFLKGSCHWLVISQRSRDDPKKCCVVSVSASNNSFETCDLPEVISKETAMLCNVAAVNGYLGLIPHRETMQSDRRDVWIMKKLGDASSWMIRYRIGREQGPVLVWRSGLLMDPSLTWFHHSEGDDIEIVRLSDDGIYIHRFTESLVLNRQGEPFTCFCNR